MILSVKCGLTFFSCPLMRSNCRILGHLEVVPLKKRWMCGFAVIHAFLLFSRVCNIFGYAATRLSRGRLWDYGTTRLRGSVATWDCWSLLVPSRLLWENYKARGMLGRCERSKLDFPSSNRVLQFSSYIWEETKDESDIDLRCCESLPYDPRIF